MDLSSNKDNNELYNVRNSQHNRENDKHNLERNNSRGSPPITASSKESSTKGKHSSKKAEKRVENDFIFGKLIGEGSFSSVYLAKEIVTQQEFAAKVCSKLLITKEKKVAQVLREKEIMNLLNTHESSTAPYFVRLAYAFQTDANLYFILSYCKHGEFLRLIQQVGNFDYNSSCFYTGEIVRALEHLHSLNVVHRDLKPENILLDESMHIKISDFGSAKILDEVGSDSAGTLRRSSFVGTAQYVSPEVLHNKQVSLASDLWSLGCIIYQIVSGLPPFRAKNEYGIFKSILALDYEFPQGFFEDAKDMVERLLVLDSTSRLGAQDTAGRYSSLRQHPFLAALDLDTLHCLTPPTITTFTPNSDDQDIWDNSIEPGLEKRELELLHQMKISKTTRPAQPSLQEQELHKQQTQQTKSQDKSHLPKQDQCFPPPKPAAEQQEPVRGAASASSASPSTASTSAASSKGGRNLADISQDDHNRRLLVQEKENKWHKFVEGNLILKQGLLDKRKGLFPRRRMFLLTTGPHLYYVDPVNEVLKGQVPYGHTIRPEGKNFRTFFVHTPNRTYYLEDPSNTSKQWMQAIEQVRDYYYPPPAPIDDYTTGYCTDVY